MKRLLVLLAASLLPATGLVVTAPAAPAEAVGELVRVRLRAAVKSLPMARETRAGYARSKFRHWIDADGDCRDARDEVLAAESLVRPRGGCDIRRGRWASYYDGRVFRYASKLDIDHMVPLAEAWDSGAKRWTAATRKGFANDLGDRRSLIAVSASSNRSKSDRDPAEWMPRYGKCTYVRQWVAVKIRWSLKVDQAEKRALASRAARCANVVVRVRKVRIGLRATSRTTTSAPPVRITGVQYDSPGSDTGTRRSLNAEWVTLKNFGPTRVALSGWTLRDRNGGHVYTFRDFALRPGRTVRVHTGRGSNTTTDRYWRQSFYVWNNTGDRAILRNARAGFVDGCVWDDGSGYKNC